MKVILQIVMIALCIPATGQNASRRIIIEVDTSILSKLDDNDASGLPKLHVYYWGDSTRTNDTYLAPKLKGKKLKWEIQSNKSLLFVGANLFGPTYIAHPGDSIYMNFTDNRMRFSGREALKYQLLYDIDQVKKNVTKPFKQLVYVASIDEYLKVDKYYDEQLEKAMSLIDSYNKKISVKDITWIKSWTIEWIEYKRLNAFYYAAGNAATDTSAANSGKYSNADLRKLWDTTQFKHWAKWLRSRDDYNNLGGPVYQYIFNRTEVWLRYNFDYTNDSLGSKPIRTLLYYEGIKRNYKGLVRERTLNFLLDEQVIVEMGANHKMAKAILKDYYSLPGFPSYKKWIKWLETKDGEATWKDNWAPPFELTDENRNIFTKNNLKNKIGIIDFWFTGCKGCIYMAPAIRKIEKHFEKDTNVIFLGVSVDADKEKWLKSQKEKKYTSGTGVQLYTGGKGADHPMIKQYEIQSYPSLVVIDHNGKLVHSNPPPDARHNDGKLLIELIQQQLLRMKDGPYVLYNETPKIYTIDGAEVQQNGLNSTAVTTITAATDIYGKFIKVDLQKKISVPPSEYTHPDSLLILSDIEGNFGAFRKLLQSNNVIDDSFNWTFGSGHLVFVGDMFDRGEQVAECLWLIYSLEEKAKAKGGYVHFILGNHELMNLQGNHSYTMEKYKKNAVLLGRTITELYDQNSELGRWLRSKNIVEKIGELLILHGGASSELNKLPISIEQINHLARPYYTNHSQEFNDKTLNTIMNTKTGVFWYRDYYKNGSNKATQQQIDSTLQKFDVNYIITGHTIVADTISMHYEGKVINTDTHHASGKSEALFIKGMNHYYRVNDKGERWPLLPDKEERKGIVQKN